jgi:sugar transferase (PEP-CTERM/EpsH1 system associated)
MSIPIQLESQSVTGSARPDLPTGCGERLRILHVISYFGRGGAEMGILKLIKGLGEGQFEHEICTTRGFDPEFAASHFSLGKVSSAGTEEKAYQFPLLRLARIIRRFRPHIVHTRNWGGLEGVPAARISAVPVVIHSEHGYEVEMFGGLPLRRRMFRRAMYPLASIVFAVTRELRDFHAAQAWVRPQSIKVIYNGVDTIRFRPSEQLRMATRRELNIPDSSFVVGSVGRLVTIKDHRTLLHAARSLAESNIDVRVLLVGAGPEMAALQSQASGALAGRVTFAGDSDRVPELLNAMDIFALPSLGEGMSNTLLEAMASSLPVAASRVGGNSEVIESEDHGWLFSPGDVGTLVRILSRCEQDRKLGTEIGRRARIRVTSVFGLDRMMENYRSMYLDLAAKCRVPDGRMDIAHVRD